MNDTRLLSARLETQDALGLLRELADEVHHHQTLRDIGIAANHLRRAISKIEALEVK